MTNARTLISMTMMIVMIMITSDVKVTVKVNLNKKNNCATGIFWSWDFSHRKDNLRHNFKVNS